MLITITTDEIAKFPAAKYDYSDPDNPVLIAEPPYRFVLLAQRMTDYLCCGEVTGDADQFVASGIMYETVTDIPAGFAQRCLPGSYGEYLSYLDILKIRLSETDYQVIKSAEYAQAGLPAPYDITTLHQARESLREQIRALEVHTWPEPPADPDPAPEVPAEPAETPVE